MCWDPEEEANKLKLHSLKFNIRLQTDYEWSIVFFSGCCTSTVTLTIITYKMQKVPFRREPRRKVLQLIVERILNVFPEELKTWG